MTGYSHPRSPDAVRRTTQGLAPTLPQATFITRSLKPARCQRVTAMACRRAHATGRVLSRR